MRIYQVDAFAKTAFQGNPAAVVPLQEWPTDDLLQKIAQENNLSETAYFIDKGDHYHLRWFTPAKEVRLCGHATLASAHVLYKHLGYTQDKIRFEVLAGTLLVEKHGDQYSMDFPADQAARSAPIPLIEEALGIEVLDTAKGTDDYLVRIKEENSLQELQPNFRLLAQLEARGLIVTTQGTDTDVASRCFYPAYGIDEDPVTGSAHTLLIPYWSKILDKQEMSFVQGGTRKGFLKGTDNGDRVLLSSSATTYLVGDIFVD